MGLDDGGRNNVRLGAIIMLWGCLALAALAGCTATTEPPRKLIHVRFACEDGSSLAVTFDQTDRTVEVLTGAGAKYVLPIGLSGSGYNYQTPERQLRGKGRDVTWSEPGAAPLHCHEIRAPEQT